MDFIIIGNGTAGINAALEIKSSSNNAKVIIISNETEYYFSRTALMYIAMDDMRLEDTEPYERNFYKKNGIELIKAEVKKIDKKKKSVLLDTGKSYSYDKLLLAAGAKPVKLKCETEDIEGTVNFVSYNDLEKLINLINKQKNIQDKKAVVVGAGLIGIELTEVLLKKGYNVSFILRGETFWHSALSEEEGSLVIEHVKKHGVNVITETEIKSINSDNGVLKSITDNNGNTISCDILGIAIGVIPNIDLVESSSIPHSKGILTDWKLQTKESDIYAAGDCVEIENSKTKKNFIRTIWYSARDMGIIAGKNMLGNDLAYEPGEWYNSAKFFDLEYTAVGQYLPITSKDENLFIADKQAEKSIRIIHNNKIILGFSTIGIRCDHEKLLELIKNKKSIDYFINNMKNFLFEPEFSSKALFMQT